MNKKKRGELKEYVCGLVSGDKYETKSKQDYNNIRFALWRYKVAYSYRKGMITIL